MHFTKPFFAALLSATSFAVPTSDVEKRAVSMMAAATPNWTIESMKRVCNKANTSCTWIFEIDTHTAAATTCFFTVNGSPASETNTSLEVCGQFTIGTGWSDQFGADTAYTTMSVVHSATKLIIYPTYTDKQLAGGKVVKPDQSYTPQNLPSQGCLENDSGMGPIADFGRPRMIMLLINEVHVSFTD